MSFLLILSRYFIEKSSLLEGDQWIKSIKKDERFSSFFPYLVTKCSRRTKSPFLTNSISS